MGILDKFKQLLSGDKQPEHPNSKEYEQVIQASIKDPVHPYTNFWSIKIGDLQVYKQEVKGWPDNKKVDFIVYAAKQSYRYRARVNRLTNQFQNEPKLYLFLDYIKQLMRSKLTLREDDVVRITQAFIQSSEDIFSFVNSWPTNYFLSKIVKQYKGKQIGAEMTKSLTDLKNVFQKERLYSYEKEFNGFIVKIDQLFFESENEEGVIQEVLFNNSDEFGAFANNSLRILKNEDRKIWFQLLLIAQKAKGSKPTKKYLDSSKELFKELGANKFKQIVNNWFEFLIPLKNKMVTRPHYREEAYLSSANITAVKGFVWMCAHFHDEKTLVNISNLSVRCYKKIPGKGPAAAGLGNACFYMLYKSKGMDGIGQLTKLKQKIKQANGRKTIGKYLLAAAKEKGVSLHQIEELAVDEYGLSDGKRAIAFNEYTAHLQITGVGKSSLAWEKPDGKTQKSDPSYVKEKHKDKLKKLKQLKKQIDQSTSAQRSRIDLLLRANRTWNMEELNQYYINHGLVSSLAKNIIWIFEENGKKQSAIYLNNQWVTNELTPFSPSTKSTISLWHPAEQSVAEIKKWRDFLFTHEVRQPIKQAHREVYLLTEAEINTGVYSNRMAAHILKQHQYVSLAKIRNWNASLIGSWDGGDSDIAVLALEDYNLKAEFWVQSVEADNAYNATGIWNYVSTDQVRFHDLDTEELLNLSAIPPIPFSEVLRDVDLFVGVASVGNDPAWIDSGELPAYRNYWRTYSFGDLSETAKNRKEILEKLLPRLKISKQSKIENKFLIVEGKLRTYKIHLGSTNILMEPNDQYLCIVPDRKKKDVTNNLFIPFEGDGGLSIILSKAFLLAADDKISDSSITSQIKMR